MTRFLDVPATARLIARSGVTRVLRELVDTLRADFLRWNDFDKSPRVACHSRDGVIALIPPADDPKNLFALIGDPTAAASAPVPIAADAAA